MESTSKISLITLQISVRDLQKFYLVCAVSVMQQLLVAMGQAEVEYLNRPGPSPAMLTKTSLVGIISGLALVICGKEEWF